MQRAVVTALVALALVIASGLPAGASKVVGEVTVLPTGAKLTLWASTAGGGGGGSRATVPCVVTDRWIPAEDGPRSPLPAEDPGTWVRIVCNDGPVHATTLYTVIAHFNSAGAGESEAAFGAALTEAGLSTAGAMLAPVESISFDSLGEALDRLVDLDRPGRASLVRGAAAAVLYDGKTTVEEAELIRIVADAVRLPVPPLLTID